MGFFKSIDEKLEAAGFKKAGENGCGAYYRRKWNNDFTQALDIMHKKSGNHLIMSYDANPVTRSNAMYNIACSLNEYETALALKKLRQMRRRYKWGRSARPEV